MTGRRENIILAATPGNKAILVAYKSFYQAISNAECLLPYIRGTFVESISSFCSLSTLNIIKLFAKTIIFIVA